MKWHYYIYILIPVILIVFYLFNFHFISSDGTQYAVLGSNLFHHGFYNDVYGVVPGWLQPPGFPVVIGVFSLFISIHYAGLISSLLFSICIIFALNFFIKKLNFTKEIKLSIIILCINPLFVIYCINSLSESLYTFIYLLLTIVVYLYVIKNKDCNYFHISIIATLSILLIYIRIELIFSIILIFILITRYISLRKAIYYFLIVVLLYLPYMFWIQNKANEFILFPKITYNMRIGKVAQKIYNRDKLTNTDIYDIQQLGWYGFDNNTSSLYSENIMDTSYYNKIRNEFGNQKTSIFKVTKHILNNLFDVISLFAQSNPFPIIFFMLFVIGFWVMWNESRKVLLFIIIWLVPSFYFLVSHVAERFFYVMLPYFSIIAAYGISYLVQKIKYPNIILHTISLLLVLNASLYYIEFYQYLSEKENYYLVAQKLKKKILPTKKVCAKDFRVTFFSSNDFCKMPYCTSDQLYRYLKKQKTQYLLLGKEVYSDRKQFINIYNMGEQSSFQFINSYNMPNQNFKLFKVLYKF